MTECQYREITDIFRDFIVIMFLWYETNRSSILDFYERLFLHFSANASIVRARIIYLYRRELSYNSKSLMTPFCKSCCCVYMQEIYKRNALWGYHQYELYFSWIIWLSVYTLFCTFFMLLLHTTGAVTHLLVSPSWNDEIKHGVLLHLSYRRDRCVSVSPILYHT